MQVISHYEVTNRHTGKTTIYKTGRSASRACDRMDLAYGAIICTRRAIWKETGEWSGSPCPQDPDNFWIDDVTGARVPA